MIRTSCITLFFALFFANTMAQNMQVLYGFDQLPQNLLLNPGAEIDYEKHIGVPLLSGIYLDIGASNESVNYTSLYSAGQGTEGAIRNLHDLGLSSKDIFALNQRIEVLNAGFRLRDPSYYLSFGMYQEINAFSAYPRDFANIFFNGNDQNSDGSPEFDDLYQADAMNTVGELVGVFHVGINKKINRKWTLGTRLKILSASIGLETKNNRGDYYLTDEPLPYDPYLHNYDDLDVVLNTSGFLHPFDLSDNMGEFNEVMAALFFVGGNTGLALDVGFTHKLTDDIDITGSVLDIGVVKYKQKITKIELTDDKIPSQDYYDPPLGSELDFWQEMHVTQQIPMETSDEAYIQFRSPKLNGSLAYNMSRRIKSKYCDINFENETLGSALGLQVYSEFRPANPLWAITAFYSRELTRYLNTKITYTYDRFSAKNIGLGLSVDIKSFNFYATADNLLALPTIRTSNYQSFQLGMNFIFN